MIGAIVQARMNSERLPGKIMMELAGKPVLWHIVQRLRAAGKIDQVVIATTTGSEDDVVEKFAVQNGFAVFRGSENDVLDRVYQTAKLFGFGAIVRITGDCPMIDPAIVDKVVGEYLSRKADYASNVVKETYPDGEDVEVMSFMALETAWEGAALASEREHVTPFIRKNPARFKTISVENDRDLSAKRWTLDNREDFELINRIYRGLYARSPLFGMKEILDFISTDPEVEKINSHIFRNEGYKKSLEKESGARI